ncbi:MAG: AmmeMemoRadiSam system protein B [candidate division KSB1 bacterium]|nr:AmmeMemoRadiSam system protein B [candidate division KSB1 bacterium]
MRGRIAVGAIALLGVGLLATSVARSKLGKEVKRPMPPDLGVRKPAVAGMWYPQDPAELRRMLDTFFENAKKPPLDGEVVGLVAPHAGFVYSGLIAAYAYKQIMGKHYDDVIVIAPSHRDAFHGASVFTGSGYETPLGVIPVDRDLAADLISQDGILHAGWEGHREEHALEAQLPFLQYALGSFRLVPIVILDRDWETCRRLGEAIARACRGKSVLLVASTDLYHGYSYDECNARDSQTLRAMEEFDPEKFNRGLNREEYQACGGGPVTAVMVAAKQLGAQKAKVLAHTTSGDVTGRKSGYVVGYGAVAFLRREGQTPPRKVGVELGLSDEDKRTLLEIARRTIEARVKGKPFPKFEVTSPTLLEPRGAFVTINKHGMLRGCIGYVMPIKPLWETVMEMAEAAALRDPRFAPVSPEEVPDLEIEISVLTVPREIRSIDEIEVGKHGLIIERGFNSGLLLPQVATEYGWDRTTFLEHTCRKAGLPPNAWKEQGTVIKIFSAEVFGEHEVKR